MKIIHRNKPGNDGADEQDWIFSYADLMSLLLCFFILLFAISVIDPNKSKKISEKIKIAFSADAQAVPEVQVFDRPTERQARAFQLLVKMLNLSDSVENAVSTVENLYDDKVSAADLKKAIEKDLDPETKKLISMKKNETAILNLVLPGDILFGPGSAALNRSSQQKILRLLESIDTEINDMDIEIQGHTDSSPLKQKRYFQNNMDLSFARAKSISSIFKLKGIDAAQIKLVGMGATRPIMPNRDRSGRWNRKHMKKNRRVELIFRKQL